MKVFNKIQEKELKKICEYIVSKDPEISKMGVQCLRNSATYRNLRPLSLFYYPNKNSAKLKTRVSTWINENIRILSSDSDTYNKTVARLRLSQMFEQLLGNEVYQYFRREFINTAKIL